MANYAALKTAIADVIKTNGNNAITGALLQQSLLSMIDSLGAGYQFIGVATPATNPGTPDQKVFYIGGPGEYSNFGAITTIRKGCVGIFYYSTSWASQEFSVSESPFSCLGTRPNFEKNASGWLLTIEPYSMVFAFGDGTNKNVTTTSLQLTVGGGSIQNLIFDKTTGAIRSQSVDTALLSDEFLIGSYFLASVNAPLNALDLAFEYTVNGNPFGIEPPAKPLSFSCFGERPNFIKNNDGWRLEIYSGTLVFTFSDGSSKTVPATALQLAIGSVQNLILNKTTGAITTQGYETELAENQYLIGSYFLENASAKINVLNLAFEYTIRKMPFGIIRQFSCFGTRPNFIKNNDGWLLEIASGTLVCSFIDGTDVTVPATNLQLTIGSKQNLVINKDTGVISSAPSSTPLNSNEFLIGTYFLGSANLPLNALDLAFEYKINGNPFGLSTPAQFSCLGTRPNFEKNESGWLLTIEPYSMVFAFGDGTNKNVTTTSLQLTVGGGSIQNLIFDKTTGAIRSQSVDTALNSNEFLIGSYFLASVNAGFNMLNAAFEYTVNGNPFGITLQDIQPQDVAINPIIPNEIWVSDDMPTPIFKHSLFKSITETVNIIGATTANNRLNAIDISEPANIEYDKVGETIRLTLEKENQFTDNIYKDVRVHKTTVASKSGHSAKILMIGDSITHGNSSNVNSSPIVKMNELLPAWYNVNVSMIGTFAPRGVTGEGRGFFSWQALIGKNNFPYGGTYGFESYGGALEAAGGTPVTTQFQNPFTFPATASDKAARPDLCFTNKKNYPDEPDGLSYEDATATERQNYHFFIFDFARYLALWNDAAHTPDIITIALGTNDWQPSGIINVSEITFAAQTVYSRIRAVLPNVKIGIITSQAIATTLESYWADEIYTTVLALQKLLNSLRENDNNIYEIPLYACGSRWLAFDGATAGVPSDITAENNIQHQTIDANVHLLDGVGSNGYWQYMNALITCLVNLV